MTGAHRNDAHFGFAELDVICALCDSVGGRGAFGRAVDAVEYLEQNVGALSCDLVRAVLQGCAARKLHRHLRRGRAHCARHAYAEA